MIRIWIVLTPSPWFEGFVLITTFLYVHFPMFGIETLQWRQREYSRTWYELQLMYKAKKKR